MFPRLTLYMCALTRAISLSYRGISLSFHLVTEVFQLVTHYFTFPVRFQLNSDFPHTFLNGQLTRCTINSPRSCYTILIPNYDHILWTCKYWRGCDGRLTFAPARDAAGSLSAGHRRPCQAPADVRHPSRTSLCATGGSTQPGAMPPKPATPDHALGRRNASTLLTCGGWEGNTLEVQKHSHLRSLPCLF